MTRNVITVGPRESVGTARKTFRAHNIHHLVVLDHGKVAGVVSMREISGRDDTLRIADVMVSDPFTASPGDSLRTAAAAMIGQCAGCLPVVENGAVVGILTTTDLMRLITHSAAPVAAMA